MPTEPKPVTEEKFEQLAVEPVFPDEWEEDEHGTRCPECGAEWVNGSKEHREQVQNSLHIDHLSEEEEAWAHNAQKEAEQETDALDRRAALGLGTEADDRHPY